jgi:NB-ARC domain
VVLAPERQALHQAVLGMNITRPWVFENAPASTQPMEGSNIAKIRACDFFILLIDENSSPDLEKELDVALQHEKPILLFLKDDRPDKATQRSDEARALIARVHNTSSSFVDATDLALKVRVSLIDEIIRRVRADKMVLSEAETQHLKHVGRELSQAFLNLPARRYTHLLGREKELDEILARLRSVGPQSQIVVAITGLGGIGKTALAYEAIQRLLLEGRFNGLVWESAKSQEFEGSKIVSLTSPAYISFESLLASIARQTGHEEWLTLSPDDLQKRVRYALQTSPYLVVVDNLETVHAYETLASQLHRLLSPSQADKPSMALLTSRERLADKAYIYDHYIEGLSEPDSKDFLQQEAENRRAQGLLGAGERLLKRVYTVTRGMPLAMQLIVSQYLVGMALDSELDRLQEAKEDELYEFIYMDLWFKLSIPAQKVMVAAAAFAASSARSMLHPVSRTTEEEFEAAIPELVRMSLIEPSNHPLASERRYSIHPITRWFINAPLRRLWEKQKAVQ